MPILQTVLELPQRLRIRLRQLVCRHQACNARRDLAGFGGPMVHRTCLRCGQQWVERLSV